TATMQWVGVLLALLLVAYGAWAGWRGAAEDAHKPYRAAAFGSFSIVAVTAGVIFAYPPLSEAQTAAVKAALWFGCAALLVSSVLYGRKDRTAKGDNTVAYGVVAAGISYAALTFLLKGKMGRGFGAPVHTYGLMLATAFGVAISLVAREVVRAFPGTMKVNGRHEDAGAYMRDHVLNLGFWVLVSAVVGSRVLFIITKWDEYRRDLSQVFSLGGGLVFYGGFIGATLAVIVYCRLHQLPFLRLADAIIPSVSVGHMIGRMGCLSAGCCWGDIAKEGSAIAVRFPAARNLPFGGFGTDSLAYTDQLRDHRWVDAIGHIHGQAVEGAVQISTYAKANGFTMPVYPTQLMESFGELAIFLALIFMRRFKRFNGQILGMWLIGYSILRTTIEFFRGDHGRGFVFRYPEVDPILLSTSQTISLAMFTAGIALFFAFGRKKKEALPEDVQAAAA
ncbi:MAG: prolipoprotein diacylglyceryl transferase, partial [Myxococcales bacterium]